MKWTKLPKGQYTGLRQELANAKVPGVGEIELAIDLMNGCLWAGLKRPGAERTDYYYITPREFCDSLIAQLAPRKEGDR